MYVNWYDRTQREAHEEATVGIALCSRRNDAVVRMTLPEGEKRIVAARYEVLLPSARNSKRRFRKAGTRPSGNTRLDANRPFDPHGFRIASTVSASRALNPAGFSRMRKCPHLGRTRSS